MNRNEWRWKGGINVANNQDAEIIDWKMIEAKEE